MGIERPSVDRIKLLNLLERGKKLIMDIELFLNEKRRHRKKIKNPDYCFFLMLMLKKTPFFVEGDSSIRVDHFASDCAQLAHLAFILGLPNSEWKYWYGILAKLLEMNGDFAFARSYAIISDQLDLAKSIPTLTYDKVQRNETHLIQMLMGCGSDSPYFSLDKKDFMQEESSLENAILGTYNFIAERNFPSIVSTLEVIVDFYSARQNYTMASLDQFPSFELEACAIASLAIRSGLSLDLLDRRMRNFFLPSLFPEPSDRDAYTLIASI